MSEYVEVRVRPVVRYVVTRFRSDHDTNRQSSEALGEYDNVLAANTVASVLAYSDGAVFEPARRLKIDWLRGPGEPPEAIRWELIDEDAPEPVPA